jgi:hypothetical protein
VTPPSLPAIVVWVLLMLAVLWALAIVGASQFG